MTGSYISLPGLELPLQCRFKTIPILNEWERQICDAWMESERAVDSVLRDWLREAAGSDESKAQKMIGIAATVLTSAFERKISPIFFVEDIRALIAREISVQ